GRRQDLARRNERDGPVGPLRARPRRGPLARAGATELWRARPAGLGPPQGARCGGCGGGDRSRGHRARRTRGAAGHARRARQHTESRDVAAHGRRMSGLGNAALLTVLAIVPLVLLTLTSFVKLSVVLSLLRNAIGAPDAPSGLVVTGLS